MMERNLGIKTLSSWERRSRTMSICPAILRQRSAAAAAAIARWMMEEGEDRSVRVCNGGEPAALWFAILTADPSPSVGCVSGNQDSLYHRETHVFLR